MKVERRAVACAFLLGIGTRGGGKERRAAKARGEVAEVAECRRLHRKILSPFGGSTRSYSVLLAAVETTISRRHSGLASWALTVARDGLLSCETQPSQTAFIPSKSFMSARKI